LEIELLVENAAKEALQRGACVSYGRHARLDAVGAHETGDTVLAHPMAAFAQGAVDPRAAVGAAAIGMHRADLGGERFMLA